jgi:hypothetical protein
MRKRLLPLAAAAFATLALSGCSSLNLDSNSQPGPRFVLEDYFQGRTYAYGLFEGRDTRLQRSFTVVADGTLSGDTLTLHETFLWNDGERQTRVWTFKKVGEDRYEGRAGDVDGLARVTTKGNALRIQYKLILPMGKNSVAVDVDDWSHLFADGAVINRADVSKFGVHVGRITLTFVKPGQARPVAEGLVK